MRIYWIWLIFSIGGVLDLTLITWNFPIKQGRKFLGLFYGIILPMTACWKVHLVFQGKAADAVMIFLVAVLILGTWKFTEIKPGGVLTTFAFLYIGGVGSELLSVGIVSSVFGLPVFPIGEAKGTMLCVMTANVLMLFYLMLGSWLWKKYAQGKRVSQDFLLFFLVLAQTIFLFWIVNGGFQAIVPITIHLILGAGIIVFGTMSFSYIQIHAEEAKALEKKLKQIELQTQKDYERYRKLEEMEKLLHHIRHDFNNQLATVYYLLKDGKSQQAGKLLDEMEQALKEQKFHLQRQQIRPEREIPKEKIVLSSFTGTGKSVPGIPTGQILLIPLGQILLLPAIGQILAAHWKSKVLFFDAGILFLTIGTDGLWLFLLFIQHRRERMNERLLNDICRQQVEQNRENAVWEGIQERKALQEELLSCISEARKAIEMIEASRELSVVQNYLLNAGKKADIRYCENELVHTVLEEKQKNCQKFHISFSVQTEVPEHLKVKGSHLCSIFTNLLDNGINACKALPEDMRFITVRSRIQGDYLYIRVSNATSKEYQNRPILPGHGLGRQIIACLTAEYQGEYWTEEDEQIYVAVVVLQIY